MSENRRLPLLPLRGLIVFPNALVHLDVGREQSMAAIEEAMTKDRMIMLSAQKDAAVENPKQEDVFEIGTIAEVKQLLKLPGGTMRILVEGANRARILQYNVQGKYVEAEVFEYHEAVEDSVEMEALLRIVVHQFEEWVRRSKKVPMETLVAVVLVEDADRFCDLVASHLNLKLEEKQNLLALLSVKERLEKLYIILTRELEVLEIEHKIGTRVRKQMEKLQKDYYLREQIKAIQKELGDKDDKSTEIEEYREKMASGSYPPAVKERVEKEIVRLEKMPNMSAENGVIRTYIDWLLALPWQKETKDRLDLKTAQKVLDTEHYGLEKVKERLLEYIAIRKLSPTINAPIICLVGPPGVGKTSLAASIARAIGRKFVRASLGGVRDEAEIRGHRRTYVGALPGRILEGIKSAESKNPVFLLDEIDKMSNDFRGDPSAALLEVLDPEQNNTFSDHYVELPFDLSKVLWIVTANSLGNIPRPLRDRMEIIMLPSYTEDEKQQIAERYLIAKQREANGLKAAQVQFSKGTVQRIIAEYTRESGVRELERLIAKVCRKAARRIVDQEKKCIRITPANLEDFLGKPKFLPRRRKKEAEVGVCTGMAWTEVGGDILPTEVSILKGKGKLILTGQLGEVMQESAQAGLSYIRSRAEKLHIDETFYEKQDIHIHLPEGAIPKDGPSAGITMATAMVSALTNRKIRSDVAMTGEITLRGRVLPIGGLKEKVIAAYREGITTVILPKENERDIEDIAPAIKEKIEFVPVENMDEVLDCALVK